ncbi:MAG: GIY-YIG nuclease family protein [Candidatus Margulisbacteria bacterium]|nr:GIY-YIG nuclease family protein [Candidatus Margulisiibacteriota bacterium]
MLEEFFYVYVLQNEFDNKFYIGYTNNLERRINEHHQGKNISTAKRLPLKLIYFEGHLSKTDAERRERYFKTNKGKTTLRQIVRNSLNT